jgi:hypothetical protein
MTWLYAQFIAPEHYHDIKRRLNFWQELLQHLSTGGNGLLLFEVNSSRNLFLSLQEQHSIFILRWIMLSLGLRFGTPWVWSILLIFL